MFNKPCASSALNGWESIYEQRRTSAGMDGEDFLSGNLTLTSPPPSPGKIVYVRDNTFIYAATIVFVSVTLHNYRCIFVYVYIYI